MDTAHDFFIEADKFGVTEPGDEVNLNFLGSTYKHLVQKGFQGLQMKIEPVYENDPKPLAVVCICLTRDLMVWGCTCGKGV